ncbi:hypothetical protein TNCV_2655161 [Trichonephila clavipes]|nr:hypothetical protein TNCV_2655161 [Trichonephila clavipes]
MKYGTKVCFFRGKSYPSNMSQGSNSSPFDLGKSTPSSGKFAGSQSAVQLLLHTFHGSKIRLNSRSFYSSLKEPQMVPFGIRRTSRTHYRFL